MADAPEHRTPAVPAGHPSVRSGWTPGRAAVMLVVVAALWLVFDRLTKLYFDAFELGEDIAGPFAGLFQFTLVHNTGGAWGVFSGSTFALGVFSLAISIVVAVIIVLFARRSTWMLTLGGALVVAGGIGNAIDRFMQGYVVDFIELSFMRFPVFNIADIGVTCGVVLIFVAVLFFWRGDDAPRRGAEDR